MCLTSTETVRLIKDGEKMGEGGKGVWRWGEREIIYLSLHCLHQNDFCIKAGSDDRHFNISLIVRDKECPFIGATYSGRVWRKMPESDARSVSPELPM